MSVLSITFMDQICLEMIFRSCYPNKSNYGVIRILRKQGVRKKILFAFSDFVLLLVLEE